VAGAEPVLVPTQAVDGFRIHAAAVVEALTERTRAVLLNSPCNPTGGLLEAEDLEQIVCECARRGVLVIADETYERFVYDGRRHSSAAALTARYPETVVVVGSFSKTYAMTGWRIGFGLGPAELIRACIAVQSHSVSNPTSFAMVGALAALEGAEAEVAAMIDEYAARRRLLMERLEAIPDLVCLPPGGAFYAFPQVSAFYRPGRQGSVELSSYLLEEARVAVVPGLAFGADDYIRISFACSRSTLEAGLDRLATALQR
jgi:aspartate aminotransferase